MNRSRTREYYLFCFLLRAAIFFLLVWYALAAPEAFLADLSHPRGLTPLTLAWLGLMASMALRLFPSRRESLGCQKKYAARFRPTGALPPPEEIRAANRGTGKSALLWIAVNLPFFLLYARGWVGRRFLVCLAGLYGVCDIFCILFYCPFQSWLMHNRCCTTCRIFDWDYLMLCTPLLAVPGPLSVSACLLSAAIFLRWEVTCRRHPERFLECGNDALRCRNCQEQLCRYKRSLSALLRRKS
ncbi:hypothetical protein [Dysosmobacter sp.]|uniref:hypothetical protein n=1 Tax=Dysosmobacter sp. TaxID=2591382 RepID=UPI002A86D3DD|nr:hypothetical protein [Dysosmobacter sp.]MDY3281412.1 hypothetical protein [Dysosmobacter sp.]